jgi:CheY-like chemotaxis protein/DNA-directed RNA polymerase specialized sigma24 family protein
MIAQLHARTGTKWSPKRFWQNPTGGIEDRWNNLYCRAAASARAKMSSPAWQAPIMADPQTRSKLAAGSDGRSDRSLPNGLPVQDQIHIPADRPEANPALASASTNSAGTAMPFRQQLTERLPYLRRYARALTGSQQSGDAYVRALLEAAIADPVLRDELVQGRVALYRGFTRIWANAHVDPGSELASLDGLERGAQARLGAIPSEHRQALLLTTLEEFTEAEAGEVLGIGSAEVVALVAMAIAEIEGEAGRTVLIIEDEPLIAMQLEELVSDLGHTVVATATTRTEAVAAFSRTAPALVLADIQLADASSGIDAIEDILKIGTVPVVFITAYPERLLTGERPEPTWLVTKPFHEQTVRAAISQALFFGTTATQV